MSYQHILLSTDGAITTLTLNRPEKRNALALEVALTGDAIDATTAADWGLINRAVRRTSSMQRFIHSDHKNNRIRSFYGRIRSGIRRFLDTRGGDPD